MNVYKTIAEELNGQPCLALYRGWSGTEGKIEDMRTGLFSLKETENADHFITQNEENAGTASRIAREALLLGAPVCERDKEEWRLAEPFFIKERLIILGGGHVALPVAEFAARIGFSVTVADDRLSFANPGRFPAAEKVICDEFEHAIEGLAIRETDYVVIVTRGHRYDGLCLRAIGRGTEPAYLGMIGSRRRVGLVRAALLEEGYDPERLARLKSPIGLAIGAVTPEEIAVSILAEIIKAKRCPDGEKRIRSGSDQDYDVLKALAETDEPAAVITVIASHGSSPRGAGAKMLAYRDGRCVGSIGGGCAEAAVLTEARLMIGSGRFKVFHVELTAESAEDEGMVCGGVMDVLIGSTGSAPCPHGRPA